MKKILEKWQEIIIDTDFQIDKLQSFFNCFDCEFIDSMQKLQLEYTRSIENQIGDNFETLSWYWFENEMGNMGHKAGSNSDLKPIKNINDLIWLIECEK